MIDQFAVYYLEGISVIGCAIFGSVLGEAQ